MVHQPPAVLDGTLPSLALLRTFEVAGRHLNFTHAADELGIGQPAVSRQVSQLERDLGVQLFERRPTVSLTEAGEVLLAATQTAFEGIDDAIAHVSTLGNRPHVTVDVSITFATCWLMGRLGDFVESHPDIDVRVVTRDRTNAFTSNADVVVYSAGRPHGSLGGDPLIVDELLVPACSVDYPVEARPIDAASLAASELLLYTEERHQVLWDDLLGPLGQPAPRIPSTRRFNSFMVYHHAILRGRGIGLAWTTTMADDLAAGRLVQVTDLSVRALGGYFVAATTSGRSRPAAQQFISWMRDAATTPSASC
jgi:DNA-binding transcriptional LysR family regulator